MLGLGLYFMTGNVVTISKERRAPIFFPSSSPSSFSSDTWRDFEKINWGTGSVGRPDNRSSGISRSAKVQIFQHFSVSCIVDIVLSVGNNLCQCLLFTRLVEVTWGWRRELPGLSGPSGPSKFNLFLTGSRQSLSLSLEVKFPNPLACQLGNPPSLWTYRASPKKLLLEHKNPGQN